MFLWSQKLFKTSPNSLKNSRFIPWLAQKERDPNVLSKSATLSRNARPCSHRAITVSLFPFLSFDEDRWLADKRGRPSAKKVLPWRPSEIFRFGEIRISGVWTLASDGLSGSICRRSVEIRNEDVRCSRRGDWVIMLSSAQIPYHWGGDNHWLATLMGNNPEWQLIPALNKSHKQQFQLITAVAGGKTHRLTIRKRPF